MLLHRSRGVRNVLSERFGNYTSNIAKALARFTVKKEGPKKLALHGNVLQEDASQGVRLAAVVAMGALFKNSHAPLCTQSSCVSSHLAFKGGGPFPCLSTSRWIRVRL
eukprot:6478587-Amphidinium_carterae.1